MSTVTREGYLFEELWTGLGDEGHRISESSLLTIASDHTLYAMWVLPYNIGDIGPAGGYVFYDKGVYSDGWRYLEAAPYGWYNGDTHSWGSYTGKDDPRFQWGAGDYESALYEVFPSAKAESVGSGKINTERIVSYHDSLGTLYPEKGDYYTNPTQYSDRNDGTVAAKVCSEFSLVKDDVTYDDWYLPSFRELWLIQSNLVVNGLGNFITDEFNIYWSSTEREREDGGWARCLLMNDPKNSSATKNNTFKIRPIRAF